MSSFFADIFKNNCLNIGVLPVEVSQSFLNNIFESIYNDAKTELKIDLPKQLISICDSKHFEKFKINSYKKENMINGYDDIDYLCSMKSKIKEFESKSPL